MAVKEQITQSLEQADYHFLSKVPTLHHQGEAMWSCHLWSEHLYCGEATPSAERTKNASPACAARWRDYHSGRESRCRAQGAVFRLLGIGGQVEFDGQRGYKQICPNKNTVSQWAIWVKMGISL